jgi:hypothetical protein
MPKTFTVRDLPKTDLSAVASAKAGRPREIRRQCSICGRKIFVRIYPDDSYRGGHFFGKIPLYTDEEFEKARRAGTTKECWGKTVVEILKKDPKPYKYEEYWECDKCYKNK